MGDDLEECKSNIFPIRENVENKTKFKGFKEMNKRYVDKGRTHREFKVGNHVFLKVKANISSLKLGKFSKFAARYCGPFEILERIGPVAYMLAFPTSMTIHNVFQV
jgi:hypothetical protein